jgi:hypothetical protein
MAIDENDDTDSDTSSDDYQEIAPDPATNNMSDVEAGEHLYWAYKRARNSGEHTLENQ